MKCTQCGKDIATTGEPIVVIYKGKYSPESVLIILNPTKPSEIYHQECWDRLIHIPKDIYKGHMLNTKGQGEPTEDPVEKARLLRADLESRTIKTDKKATRGK